MSDAGRTVLIADDDPRLRNLLIWTLEQGQYNVVAAEDGLSALEIAKTVKPDLYLLDVGMPGLNGIEVCRRLRAEQVITPILMLTGFGAEEDKVAGLEAGADDYVTKPFVAKELAARIRALLRRVRAGNGGSTAMAFGDVVVVPEEGAVRRGDEEIHLTRTEFHLLCELAGSPGKVFSREQLLERVWGYDYFGDGRLVDVHIRRLRTKIEPDAANPRHVVTVRRLGYKLVS